MSSINLFTSLARARNWAGITSSSEDSLINALIAEVSRFILSYLGRAAVFDASYTEVIDGAGQQSVFLRHWPVTSVSSLSVDGNVISAAVSASLAGYILERWDGMPAGFQQRLSLRGYVFAEGVGNVSVTYNAGYKISGEARVVPASGSPTITVDAPYGSFAADGGVTYASGAALAFVASAPVVGQYTVNAGVYSFAAADAGAEMCISYSYIPSDLEHACVALVAERYRYRSRIGEISKSLGGQETASYSQKDMPEFVRTLLQPYRRVL